MKILANENFPNEAVQALRSRGHDVSWVRTDSAGATDHEVIEKAVAEGRILITFDKDFGEIAFRARLTTSVGIVLFRISPSSPSKVAQVAVAAFETRTDWAGHFSVVEENRIRMTSLPR